MNGSENEFKDYRKNITDYIALERKILSEISVDDINSISLYKRF